MRPARRWCATAWRGSPTRDGAVKAFVNFDPECALSQARALDRGPRRGPLHGVPIGLKDTIDTFDMPTEMGSPIYRGNRPRAMHPASRCCAAPARSFSARPRPANSPAARRRKPPTRTMPRIRLAARRADRRRRSPISWCRRRSARKPAARCCGHPRSAVCSVISRRTTRSTKPGVWPAAASIDTIGWLSRSIDDIALLTAVLRMERRSGCAS